MEIRTYSDKGRREGLFAGVESGANLEDLYPEPTGTVILSQIASEGRPGSSLELCLHMDEGVHTALALALIFPKGRDVLSGVGDPKRIQSKIADAGEALYFKIRLEMREKQSGRMEGPLKDCYFRLLATTFNGP